MLQSNLPHFTIVMPSHNRCALLQQALERLACQNYPASCFDLVLVLDGCTDGSAAMVTAQKGNWPFAVQVIEQPQGGPAAARNAGVRAATGAYILFLDDDVMATPDLLLTHARQHQNRPDRVVVGTMSKAVEHRGPIWVRWEEYILEQQYQDMQSGKYSCTFRQFYTGNSSLQRKWLLEAGLFDESFKRYEDVELAARLDRMGVEFIFDPQAVGYHYPSRSFASWLRAHYLYGVYAVRIEGVGRQAGMIALLQKEFSGRHKLTRWLSEGLLNHKRLQLVTAYALMRVAQVAGLLRQDRLSFAIMSCIANFCFWQSFNEELGQVPLVNPTRSPAV